MFRGRERCTQGNEVTLNLLKLRPRACLSSVRLIRADWDSDTHETAPEGIMDVYTLHKSLFEVHALPLSLTRCAL